jgi:hypothetical protein
VGYTQASALRVVPVCNLQVAKRVSEWLRQREERAGARRTGGIGREKLRRRDSVSVVCHYTACQLCRHVVEVRAQCLVGYYQWLLPCTVRSTKTSSVGQRSGDVSSSHMQVRVPSYLPRKFMASAAVPAMGGLISQAVDPSACSTSWVASARADRRSGLPL